MLLDKHRHGYFTPKRITVIAISLSFALTLSAIERMIPPFVPIPGIKIGLPNIVSIFALFYLDFVSALIIVLLRSLLSTALFGSLTSFLFSLFGGVLSLLIMTIMRKKVGSWFSYIGLSIAGAAFHNIGQIIAASIILKTFNIFAYLPLLFVGSIIMGLITGLLYTFVDNRLIKISYFRGIRGGSL